METTTVQAMLNVDQIRKDFPILSRQIHGKPLVYLDNAATSQKPQVVLDALSQYYSNTNANVHRGIHLLAEEATEAYEAVRVKTARFLNAPSEKCIVFTRNATESVNLLAQSWGRSQLKPGDEILLTEMEHHSNLVPWQMVAEQTQAKLQFIPVTDDGYLALGQIDSLISSKTKIVSLTLMSNVLGTINAVDEVIEKAQALGAKVFLDAAQAAPHMPIDVQALGCDALVCSSHKMLGPTGVGVLYAKEELLEAMPPFLGGGEMILDVKLEKSTWNEVPFKFEAGTPNIAGVVAFGAALDYLTELGMENVRAYEHQIAEYAFEKLSAQPDVHIYGPQNATDRGAVFSFSIDELHPHDIGTVLDAHGIAVRAGHHCAKPLMRRYGVPAMARASFYIYNQLSDVDKLIEGIQEVRHFFKIKH